MAGISGYILCRLFIFILSKFVPTELAPLEDRNRITITAVAPEGATFEYMDHYMEGAYRCIPSKNS